MARICIVGLGAIGGSLALALREAHDVVGVDVAPEVVEEARVLGIEAASDLSAALKKADGVVLAVPLGRLSDVLRDVARQAPAKALITDVGSVKGQICKVATQILPQGRFVGGHPMAGSELRGLSHASPELFRGCTYVWTPEREAERKAMTTFRRWFASLGAQWVEMEPSAHDLAVAYTSHLPFLMATAVARVAQGSMKEIPDLRKVAAAGFRDTTRLAMSNPILGRDICIANRDALLHAIVAMRYQLSQFEIMLQSEISVGLESMFESVGKWREDLMS
ncbi:MAG: prephenate dehydrogenase/arogenate dehydrogenase family protein [bacterium]|nr:prephenate dehydrogenase/arogenate dehydrogenase family protein [bacterium]